MHIKHHLIKNGPMKVKSAGLNGCKIVLANSRGLWASEAQNKQNEENTIKIILNNAFSLQNSIPRQINPFLEVYAHGMIIFLSFMSFSNWTINTTRKGMTPQFKDSSATRFLHSNLIVYHHVVLSKIFWQLLI